jgi:hypothetical protein
MGEKQKLLQELLLEERRLREAYVRFLPLLRPAFLQKKARTWSGEGEKHIHLLEELLDPMEYPEVKKSAPEPVDPPDFSANILLQYFYESEERLYYLYMNASKQAELRESRTLLESNLQDQRKHLAEIQKIYTDSLYH